MSGTRRLRQAIYVRVNDDDLAWIDSQGGDKQRAETIRLLISYARLNSIRVVREVRHDT